MEFNHITHVERVCRNPFRTIPNQLAVNVGLLVLIDDGNTGGNGVDGNYNTINVSGDIVITIGQIIEHNGGRYGLLRFRLGEKSLMIGQPAANSLSRCVCLDGDIVNIFNNGRAKYKGAVFLGKSSVECIGITGFCIGIGNVSSAVCSVEYLVNGVGSSNGCILNGECSIILCNRSGAYSDKEQCSHQKREEFFHLFLPSCSIVVLDSMLSCKSRKDSPQKPFSFVLKRCSTIRGAVDLSSHLI